MTTSTAFTKGYFGRLTQGFGLPGLHGRNHYGARFHDEGDGGGDGEGAGGGDEGGDAGAGGENQGPAVAYDFKDENAFVRVPGVKDPVAVKDLLQSHTSRARHDAGLKVMGQLAEALQKQQQGQRPQRQPQQPQPRRRAADLQNDPLTRLEGNELPDGKAIAQTLRDAYGAQIEPLVKALPVLLSRNQNIERVLGRILGNEAQTNLSSRFSSIVGTLKVPKLNNADLPDSDVLTELVADIYHSHDDESQKNLSDQVLSEMVGKRFKTLQRFFKNYEKAQLEDAQRRAKSRIFARPGKGTSANGRPTNHLAGKNRAAVAANVLFDGVAPTD